LAVALDHYLAPLRRHLEPPDVTELVVNRPGEFAIERLGGWEWVQADDLTEAALRPLAVAAAAVSRGQSPSSNAQMHVPGPRQRLGQCGLGRREMLGSVVREKIRRSNQFCRRHRNQCVDIAGIERQRAIETVACPRKVFRRGPFVVLSQTLKIEVERIWVRRCFGAASFGGGELDSEPVGKPGDNLVLHVEEVADRVVEALGPKVRSCFSFD
jgi:hypothetical protein